MVAAGGSPRFSPDGKFIAFAAKNADSENTSIFVVGAQGGAARRLTTGSARDSLPAWSADGRSIYFRSDHAGDFNLWKILADGSGEAVQITRRGAFEAFAAPGGKEFFYTKEPGTTGLWRVPIEGGEETQVAELAAAGRWRSWTITPAGVYFVAYDTQPPYKIKFYDFETRRVREAATTDKIPLQNFAGLSVAANGKTILYAQNDQNTSSIMLAELAK